MKLLPMPAIADEQIIRALANNAQLASHPHLRNRLARFIREYRLYEAAAGNAWTQPGPRTWNLPPVLKKALENHYKNPPQALGFIGQILGPATMLVCPMCGSARPSTKDHVFPRATFPHFSVFSRNLVPACDCNVTRQANYRGAQQGARVLHPYYDNILCRRLLRAGFQGSLRKPRISLSICISSSNPHYAAVKYHRDKVVLKTLVQERLDARWAGHLRDHESYLAELPVGQITDGQLRRTLRAWLDRHDRQAGTPNNWESMLYAGMLHSRRIVPWLRKWINGVRQGNIDPRTV